MGTESDSTTKPVKKKSPYVPVFVATPQELEDIKIREKEKGNKVFKCQLPCNCNITSVGIYKVGYKVYYDGNDTMLADEVYLLCPKCATL